MQKSAPRYLGQAFFAAVIGGWVALGLGHIKATTIPFWPTVVVVGVMFLYGFVIYHHAKSGRSHPEDGDTFYYLGFIYTLGTLVLALLPYILGAKPDDSLDQRRVLAVFGIGLVTTFIGLAGRIVFAQWLQTFDKSEDAAHSDVAQSLHNLSRRIDSAALDLESVLTGARLRLTEAVDGAAGDISAAAKKLAETVETSVEQPIREAAQSLARGNAEIARAMSESSDAVVNARDGLVISLSGLKEAYGAHRKAVEKQLPLFEATLERSTQQLQFMDGWHKAAAERQSAYSNTLEAAQQRINTELERFTPAVTSMAAAASQVETLIRQSAQTSKSSMSAAADAAESHKAALAALAESLKLIQAGALELQTTVNKTTLALSDSAKTIVGSTGEIASLVVESNEAVNTVHSQLVQMTKKLVDEVR